MPRPLLNFCLRSDYGKDGQSIIRNGVRYFTDKWEARQFVCLHMLLTSPYLLADERRADAFVSVPAENKVDHKHIHAIRVLPDGRRTKDKGRPPSLVIVAYRKGGVGYYLADHHGSPTTPVYLRIPPSLGLHSNDAEEPKLRPYLAILAHRKTGGKVEVLVRWHANDVSWEFLNQLTKQGTHWHAHCYAKQHKLLDSKGWSKVSKWEAWKVEEDSVTACTHFETIQRAIQEEEQFLHRRQAAPGKAVEVAEEDDNRTE
jgi:hypothetical protein